MKILASRMPHYHKINGRYNVHDVILNWVVDYRQVPTSAGNIAHEGTVWTIHFYSCIWPRPVIRLTRCFAKTLIIRLEDIVMTMPCALEGDWTVNATQYFESSK